MPTNTYTPIGSVTLATATSSVTFTVPTGYRDLILISEAKASSTLENLYITINGDTTAGNYSYVLMLGTGSGSGISAAYTARTWGEADTNQSLNIYQFQDASATDKHKTVLFRTNRAGGGVLAQAGRWANTNPITSIALAMGTSQSFQSGSTFNLFGIVA